MEILLQWRMATTVYTRLIIRERERERERLKERERERERDFHTSLIQIKEKVDARDLSMGAWFEAQVVKVTTEPPQTDVPCSSATQVKDTVYYHVQYDE